MENRYEDGLWNICKSARDVARILVAAADAEEDKERASTMRIMARAFKIVEGWVIDTIRDADAEVRNGGRRQ